MRDAEKKGVVAELRKLIGHYDIQAAELFSDVKPSTAARPAPARGKEKARKGILPPKYQDPVSGRTWSGHGKRPLWIVGDKEKYLIGASSSAAKASVAKPKKNAPGGADWKSRVAKLTEAAKATKKPNYTGKKRGRKPKNATVPKADLIVQAMESKLADLPLVDE
jgi:DNA-binding protein H-NS